MLTEKKMDKGNRFHSEVLLGHGGKKKNINCIKICKKKKLYSEKEVCVPSYIEHKMEG